MSLEYYVVPCNDIDDKVKIIKSFPRERLGLKTNGSGAHIGGPVFCMNCRYQGSVNGIWIGYCGNCSVYIHNNKVNAFHWPCRQYLYENENCLQEVTEDKDNWDSWNIKYAKEINIEKDKEIESLKNCKIIPPINTMEFEKLISLGIVTYDKLFDFVFDEDYLVVSCKKSV